MKGGTATKVLQFRNSLNWAWLASPQNPDTPALTPPAWCWATNGNQINHVGPFWFVSNPQTGTEPLTPRLLTNPLNQWANFYPPAHRCHLSADSLSLHLQLSAPESGEGVLPPISNKHRRVQRAWAKASTGMGRTPNWRFGGEAVWESWKKPKSTVSDCMKFPLLHSLR